MDKSFIDTYVDELKGTMMSIRLETQEMFRGKKPFRKEPMTNEEAVAQYMSFDPQVLEQFRMESPDAMADYEAKIQKIMEGYNG